MAAMLLGMYLVPRGWAPVGLVGFLFALFAYSRRGTSLYKYLLFIFILACLAGISYGGWRYWKTQRYHYSSKMADDFYQRERMMGFDPVAALGSFGSNYTSRYNSQVVLRIWDSIPPVYLKAASYEKYVAGIWKLPVESLARLYPAYYQVDYAVFETADSITRVPEMMKSKIAVRQVWVQSTLDNFGFMFTPYGAVGYAAKDVDSLTYFSGGMVQGLNSNGKRSDWYYFVCNPVDGTAFQSSACQIPDSLAGYTPAELLVGEKYFPLIDTVIAAMGLQDSLYSESVILQKILAYNLANFTYSYSVPGISRWNNGVGNVKNDPLAIFWREKQGFCEYFATMATLVLRRLNIPARYVTGFANPEVVEGRPYSVFRRKHSHAWVEAFVDGHWVIFDPTPPVLIPVDFKPSWWNLKWESLRGRFARLVHLLKEGGWRHMVDRFQHKSRSIVESPVLYAVLLVLLVFFAGRMAYRAYKDSLKSRAYVSAKALEWSKKLYAAERNLARLGYRRERGETVGAFVRRISKQNAEHAGKNPKFDDWLAILMEYENSRWKR